MRISVHFGPPNLVDGPSYTPQKRTPGKKKSNSLSTCTGTWLFDIERVWEAVYRLASGRCEWAGRWIARDEIEETNWPASLRHTFCRSRT